MTTTSMNLKQLLSVANDTFLQPMLDVVIACVELGKELSCGLGVAPIHHSSTYNLLGVTQSCAKFQNRLIPIGGRWVGIGHKKRGKSLFQGP